MVSDTEKKGKSWFKNVLSSQSQMEKKIVETQPLVSEVDPSISTELVEESQSTLADEKKLFSKDSQDKIAMDVMVAIETMLKDRQLLTYKNKGLEDQLAAANETINRLKHEQIKKDQLVQEKNKEIRELENNLTNKQMSYDQLLEDYKTYQLASNMEYEKISNQLETEVAKYNKLYEESSNTQYQNMQKINTLEDKIRSLEIENQKYSEQYQKIVEEKTELIKTINDFTEKMSFSFSSKTVVANTSQSE